MLLFNKPYGVLCQFTDSSGRETLAGFIDAPGYYPAGRLDRDSEGLLLLTRNGALQQRISHPRFKLTKQYLVQVDGAIDEQAIDRLRCGVSLKDGPARALHVERVSPPDGIWPRDPPVRVRRNIPTSWVRISLQEGRNRQVRRMTAAVNHPTLRLIRTHIGACEVWSLRSGQWRFENQSALFA
ncbi:MAG: pseudouridine synthase [Granulosicoccus sp.]|nr:pseudouridine synthase [Granulosicoccus sp.]